VKNKFSLALVALIIFSFALPVFVFAQTGQPGSSASRSRRTDPPVTTQRRDLRGNQTGPVADDFKEALSIIEEKYVDGNKLDYNNVYKSSIMGMLRTLDPHSSYFDREEFDELKTDQRSEYYGIGASIQNYSIGEQVETYITATFQNSPANRSTLRYGDPNRRGGRHPDARQVVSRSPRQDSRPARQPGESNSHPGQFGQGGNRRDYSRRSAAAVSARLLHDSPRRRLHRHDARIQF
jgi:hypothetical protein